MEAGDVRAWFCGEHGEAVRLIAGPLSPETGDGHERSTVQCEPHLGLRRTRADEFEEGGGRDEHALLSAEVASFRTKIENRRCFSALRLRKSPLHLNKLDRLAYSAHHWRHV